MATFNLTAFNFTGASGYVSGLQYDWNRTNYTEAYLEITKGGSVVSQRFTIYPPLSGTNDYTSSMTASFPATPAAGTYVITAYVKPSGSPLVAVGSETRYIYTLTLTPGNGISTVSGGDDYIGGTSASASATVDTSDSDYDYVWDGWYKSGILVSDLNPFPFVMNESKSIVAEADTKLKTPTEASHTATQTSISITLNSVTSATTYYARINGGSWQSGSYPGPFNFTGLTKNTTYTIEYYCSAIGYINSNTNSSSITTPDNVKPDPWSWSASNGSASSAQTQAAYNAVIKTSGYDLSDFSYLVWNDLIDKVDAFAVYKSSSAVESGAKMTTSDKALSALRFNKLLVAVNAMASTGITSRSAGQLVYGSYFTTITSTLNNIT